MDVGQRLQVEAALSRLLLPPVLQDELRQLRLDRCRPDLSGKQQVGVGRRPVPLLLSPGHERFQRRIRSKKVGVEVGVLRDVLDDAGDFEVSPSFVAEHLAEGVFIAEVFAGRRGGDDDGERGVERRGGIALQERKREDVEDRRVGEKEAFLLKLSLLIPEDERRLRIQPDGVLDGGGIRVLQARADFVRRAGQPPDAALVAGVAGAPVFSEAIDTVGLLMKSIIAQFVLHVQHDQQATRHPHRQPERVDEGVALVSPQVTQGNLQVVLDHGL